MRLFRFALAAGAVLALAAPARAQRRDESGMVAITTTTRHPVRVAYRAGIDVLSRGGYAISVMSLDRVLMTPEQGEDGRPSPSVVQLRFEPKGDSTQVVVTAVVPDAAGRDVCRTDRSPCTSTSTRRLRPGRACPPASPVAPPRRAERETVTAAATYGAA